MFYECSSITWWPLSNIILWYKQGVNPFTWHVHVVRRHKRWWYTRWSYAHRRSSHEARRYGARWEAHLRRRWWVRRWWYHRRCYPGVQLRCGIRRFLKSVKLSKWWKTVGAQTSIADRQQDIGRRLGCTNHSEFYDFQRHINTSASGGPSNDCGQTDAKPWWTQDTTAGFTQRPSG